MTYTCSASAGGNTCECWFASLDKGKVDGAKTVIPYGGFNLHDYGIDKPGLRGFIIICLGKHRRWPENSGATEHCLAWVGWPVSAANPISRQTTGSRNQVYDHKLLWLASPHIFAGISTTHQLSCGLEARFQKTDFQHTDQHTVVMGMARYILLGSRATCFDLMHRFSMLPCAPRELDARFRRHGNQPFWQGHVPMYTIHCILYTYCIHTVYTVYTDNQKAPILNPKVKKNDSK